MLLLDVRPDHLVIIQDILKKHIPSHEVWAFGSRAKWLAKEYSDLDLCLVGEIPLSFTTLSLLTEAFEESNLPWKVDVVDWAAISESFQKIIERDKVVVQKPLGIGLITSENTLEQGAIYRAPTGWEEVTLFDVMEVISGGTPKTNVPAYWNGGIPWLSVADFNTGYRWVSDTEKRITEKGLAESAASLLCQGDIIISARGTVGVLAQLLKPMAFNQSCYGVRGKIGISETNFLYYLLQSAIVNMKQIAHGGVFDTITRDTFKLIKCNLPSLPEQRAIAHILGTLDDKIELNRKQNETLEAMAQALFKAWFVDFEPVRAKQEGRWPRGGVGARHASPLPIHTSPLPTSNGEPVGARHASPLPSLPAALYDLFPDRLVESEWGEIPEGWEVGRFSDAVEIIGGGTPKTSVSEYWDGEIPWFSVVDTPASSDVFVVQTEKSITQAGLNGSSARLITKGTTIISARGTVGNLAIAGGDMTFNQSCYALRGKNGSGSYFVFLSAQRMVEQLKAMAHGSVFSTITQQTFEAVQAVLPPQNVLQQFEQNVAGLLDPILGNVNESRTLATLRDTLLPKLISGELRVPDAEAFRRGTACRALTG